MLCLIDNYDSFTFNIVQYLKILGENPYVIKNDEMSIEKIAMLSPSKIIISPGPCTPQDSGITLDLISYFKNKVPILGVCLGHEAIAEVFGGRVVLADRVMHGKVSDVYHNGVGVFRDVISPFKATRYHSLIVDNKTLPDELEITAWCDTDEYGMEIMGLRHREYDIEGVQFHPESILTQFGLEIFKGFVDR